MFRCKAKEDLCGVIKNNLRIETDLKTSLNAEKIAEVLRRVTRGEYIHGEEEREVLMRLAEGIERDSRVAPEGTRGVLLMEGPGMTLTASALGEATMLMIEHTKSVTLEPGEILELQLGVVVAVHRQTKWGVRQVHQVFSRPSS